MPCTKMDGIHLFYLSVISACLIVLSYLFIDRQTVWFLAAHHSRHLPGLKLCANTITDILKKLIVLYYIYYFLKKFSRKVGNLDKKLVLTCNAVAIGQFLKEFLKYVFGRCWPETWVCHNPSLLNGHAYGFHWFTSGSTYASFPSGHATFIFSFAASMWFLFPKLRWLWALLAALVTIGQVGMYYHFVSDVMAGALLGTLVGVGIACHKDGTA